jgi:hypothetical protein
MAAPDRGGGIILGLEPSTPQSRRRNAIMRWLSRERRDQPSELFTAAGAAGSPLHAAESIMRRLTGIAVSGIGRGLHLERVSKIFT